MNSAMLIRKHFEFRGSVQGVGFRYRAYYAARMYGVNGYVRNLPDGSVELEAEGTEQAIDEMIEHILSGHFIEVEDINVKKVPLCGSHSFEVRD